MKSFILKISLISIYIYIYFLSQGCDTYAYGTIKIATHFYRNKDTH